jgi:hypothetical protein
MQGLIRDCVAMRDTMTSLAHSHHLMYFAYALVPLMNFRIIRFNFDICAVYPTNNGQK